jgi:hypothetical protein
MKKLDLPPPNSRSRRRKKRRVSLREILIMSIETLWNNKLRTGLTMLGVIIGIASVIMITAVGQGVQKSTALQIQALGTNVMIVSAGAARTGGISQGAGSASTLTWEDAQAIATQVPAAKLVSAFLQRPQIQVVRGNLNIATLLVGTKRDSFLVKVIWMQVAQWRLLAPRCAMNYLAPTNRRSGQICGFGASITLWLGWRNRRACLLERIWMM